VRLGQNGHQEVVLRAQFGAEFVGWVDGRIDLSSEAHLCSCQCFHYLLERCISDYEQVDVAGGLELTAARGPENEGHNDTLAE
jgi:hypothetical protein